MWLLCNRQDLLVSADDGATWQTRHLPTDVNLRAIAFIDSRRGFVAGDSGTLLATEDGAETWHPVSVPTRENLTSIHFVGELGWLAGWTGVILHSEDAGKNWVRQETGVQQGLESIFFADSEHGWAVGWLGTILRTADGGKNWVKAQTPATLWSLDSVSFRNTKEGWVVGFGGQLLRSVDGGITWKEQTSPVREWLKSVACDGAGRWWVASDNEVLVSDDAGESWTRIPVERTVFVHQVLPARGSVWAVGQFGVLKQTGDGPKLTALATLPEARGPEVRIDN
jgi:photosystem II stability/assembly factor-like uncharacterized protein